MVPAELLGLEGVEIEAVERSPDGRWTVHVRSTAGRQADCTGCGQVAGGVKEPTLHTLKHLVLIPMHVLWHRYRFWCDNDDCPTVTFAERGAVAGPGAGVPAQAGADVMDADTGQAERPCRSVSGMLPRVEVLGIDDHRRGRPLYHWDAAARRWVADAGRWQAVFVDSAGGHGLLGQVEGRAGLDTVAWPSAQDPAWRAAIRHVTIDMSGVYKSAVVKHGLLPRSPAACSPALATPPPRG